MLLAIGFLIVIASMIGGYLLSHGDLLALWQPYELLIICGCAFGAFLISNPVKVIKLAISASGRVFGKSKYSQKRYMELLSLIYEILNKTRREGMMAIEADIDSPEESEIFTRYPSLLADGLIVDFICDYLRIIAAGNMTAFELESLIDMEIETRIEELEQPSMAIAKVADSLPGFGIVAAVLGIVVTMRELGGPPDKLGVHVAAALVGTFLGVYLAYGFVGPLGNAIEHRNKEEVKFYECIKVCLLAMVNGVPPQLAVEYGRKTLFSAVRPTFTELEDFVRHR